MLLTSLLSAGYQYIFVKNVTHMMSISVCISLDKPTCVEGFLCRASGITEDDLGTVAYNSWKHNCSKYYKKPANVMKGFYIIHICNSDIWT